MTQPINVHAASAPYVLSGRAGADDSRPEDQERPSTDCASQDNPRLIASRTTTKQNGIGLPPRSDSPLNICTGVTRSKPSMSGVPSSVKLQTNTISPPPM